MSNQKATTLTLTVKVVRECAIKTLNFQRQSLDERLREVARAYNVEAAQHNISRWTRLFKLKPRPLVMVDEVIETWKTQWKAGKMDGDHLAYDILWVSKTAWWKRLKQFENLPTCDDEKVMQVSIEDLDLFGYNLWMKEQSVTA